MKLYLILALVGAISAGVVDDYRRTLQKYHPSGEKMLQTADRLTQKARFLTFKQFRRMSRILTLMKRSRLKLKRTSFL